jgi:hypothetical protein
MLFSSKYSRSKESEVSEHEEEIDMDVGPLVDVERDDGVGLCGARWFLSSLPMASLEIIQLRRV